MKNLKKLASLLLALTFVFSFAAVAQANDAPIKIGIIQFA